MCLATPIENVVIWSQNTLADVLEALIGAYLVKDGPTKVMEFMAWAWIIALQSLIHCKWVPHENANVLCKGACDYRVNLHNLENTFL